MRFCNLIIVLLWSAQVAFSANNSEEARLMRFPTIHGDQIVFTYGGDLYQVSRSGGTARKLTSHKGYEIFPRFSNDGNKIAFTGKYDGNREVYTMPAEGGTPERKTYSATIDRDHVWERMGPNNIVMGWKHDTNKILYRSRWRHFNPWKGDLKLINSQGGMPDELPLPSAGFASYSPDNEKLAFNRIFRQFRTWKHYRGGMAGDIYIFDFNTKSTKNITQHEAQDIIPMWHGNKIYFLSDRDWRMNLYSYDLESQEIKQLTDFKDFDIKFPSLGQNAIVFEKGGYIYVYDLQSDELNQVDININDDNPGSRKKRVDASDNISSSHIAPDGNRALFSGRGDVFSVPAESGITYNLTESSGVHNRNARWSPDGTQIAYISDQTGEDEIYVMPSDGSEPPQQLTTNGDTYKYQIKWSPDGEKLMWSDKKMRLHYINVNNQDVTQVDQAQQWEIKDYEWSPNGEWIVYSKPEVEKERTIYAYNVANEKERPVTRGWYPSYQPTISDNGQYLYFISKRSFNPIYSRTEWNHAYVDMAKIYVVPLTKDLPSPFAPKNDEVSMDGASKKQQDQGNGNKKDKDNVDVEIDFENIADRIESLPVNASRYWDLTDVKGKLFYMENSHSDKKPTLYSFDLDKSKKKKHGHIKGFEVAVNNKKMMVKKGGDYAIIDVPKGKVKLENKLDLSNMKVWVNLHEEWKQIFNETWRQMRDFFYAPNMNGMDWKGIRQKYEPLVNHVNHRADLNYIAGEMIAELNAGHCYVGNGDLPEVETIKMGLLGAELSKDPESGYFQVDRVLEGANWKKSLRSPLTQSGVEVEEGDYIIAVNGASTDEMPNIYQSLTGKAGKQVEFRVNESPQMENSRKVIVKPIGSEKQLYYYNWVQNNMDKVNEASNGKIGYVHIPDMARNGLNEFVENFYPQLRKKALILDVRGNGGGNVSPMLIERLRRELAMYTKPRNGEPRPNPSDMIMGPKVCLMDEWSASDGDLFPYRFRKHNLGKLVGQRTWGGVVGIRGSLPFVDGGTLHKPEFAKFDTEGEEWIIEGHGVEPDIEVFNDPYKQYQGTDQQLQKAIDIIQKQLEDSMPRIPDAPPYHDKSEGG